MKDATVTGFSISPTHVHAVRLATRDFTITHLASRTLPPAIVSHDGKRLLDPDSLTPLLLDMVKELGHPEFSEPVYLSVQPAHLALYKGPLETPETLETMLLDRTYGAGCWAEKQPILQESLLWQHGEVAAVVHAALETALLQDYCKAFYEAGLKVTGLDLIPWAVLRALAASGVLDAMLRRIGMESVWGCFGPCGSQTWVTLWDGPTLISVTSFTTPSEKSAWEEAITAISGQAMGKPVKIWLAWQEMGQPGPIDPLKLKLGVPIRPTLLGPYFGRMGKNIALAALGTALRCEFEFPLGWNYLADPASQPLQSEFTTIPYVNYQPVLPKLLARLMSFGVVLTLLVTIFLLWQNHQISQDQGSQVLQWSSQVSDLTATNNTFTQVFRKLNAASSAQVQLEHFALAQPGVFSMKGRATNEQSIKQLTSRLLETHPQYPVMIRERRRQVTPGPDKQYYVFEFAGDVEAQPR